jgi:CheY-like chemotaxis protein
MQVPTVILAVDDEPGVRQLIGLSLRRVGYEVLEAAGGEEALAILAERPDVTLVLLDCRMPGMSGSELAKAILVQWPAMKLIASSGDPKPPDMPEVASFLAKPYRPSVMIAHVAERLRC